MRSYISKTEKSRCLIFQKDKHFKQNRSRSEEVHPLTLTSAVETLRDAAEKIMVYYGRRSGETGWSSLSGEQEK